MKATVVLTVFTLTVFFFGIGKLVPKLFQIGVIGSLMKSRTLLYLAAAALPGACSTFFVSAFGAEVYETDLGWLNAAGFIALIYFGFMTYHSHATNEQDSHKLLHGLSILAALGAVAGFVFFIFFGMGTN